MNPTREVPKVSKETIIRTVLLALALTNNILTMKGLSPLPFEQEIITEIISIIFTTVVGIWAWWKNNSFTPAALEADVYLSELKNEDDDEPEPPQLFDGD